MEWKHEQDHLRQEIELLQQQVKALKSQTSQRGVIGLTLERSFPWRVLEVNEVMNEKGKIVNDKIQIGDELCEINGWQTNSLHDVTEIFDKLRGPPGSLIRVKFRDDSGSSYGIIIQLHIPLRQENTFGNGEHMYGIHEMIYGIHEMMNEIRRSCTYLQSHSLAHAFPVTCFGTEDGNSFGSQQSGPLANSIHSRRTLSISDVSSSRGESSLLMPLS